MAGGLKQELIAKYGIKPKMKHAYHELEIIVNGESVFSYSRAHKIPTVASLLKLVENATTAEASKPVQTGNCSCSHATSCGLGSAVSSSTRFSRMSLLLTGFERSAKSARAIFRIALVSSRFDLYRRA